MIGLGIGVPLSRALGAGPAPATHLPHWAPRHRAVDAAGERLIGARSSRTDQLLEPPVGPIRPPGGPSEHDDLCIDGGGLVLSEAWTLDGRLVLGRTATAVRLSGFSLPAVEGASPPKAGASRAVAAPGSGGLLARPRPPPGFQALAPVQFGLPDPMQSPSLVAASVVWSFVRGPDSVTVEAGSERPGQLPWQADDTVTEPLRLAGLGPARSAIRSDGAEVRVDLGGGNWGRVRGTVPASALADYASGLEPSSTASSPG